MTKPRIINLTPHAINLCDKDGVLIEQFPPSGNIARVTEVAGEVLTNAVYDGIPVRAASAFGEVMVGTQTFTEFVQAQDDALALTTLPFDLFLVSGMVASALGKSFGGRSRVLAPDTSSASAVRNDAGHIVGVKGLVRSF